ncbi:MAG: sigma-70 family RNA polymerase sigma factor [Chlorobi bacterium]|nr:sigma-70 family RNA polymerase sigma factor [Chlorobiota bacterium]
MNKLTNKGQRDYKLVKQALNDRSQTAYAELLNLYRDSLYFSMLRMTNNPNDAEDLTIEAFGKAFKNLHQYTPEYAFSTWLFKIAINNGIDFIRKKKIQNELLPKREKNKEDNIANKVAGKEPNPEEVIINKQKIKMMREVIHRLKPHYKKLIELRYFDELSYEEIVQELDLPIGTVKVQLFRARTFLYNILKSSRETI